MLNNLTLRKQIVLTICLIAILSGVYYFKIYQPKVDKLKKNRLKINDIESEIKSKRGILKNEKRLKYSYKQLKKKIGYSDSIIYQDSFLTSSKTVELIVDLNKQAMTYNVSLLKVKSSEIEKGDLYHKFPIKIEVEGKYEQVLNYLKSIKQNDYLTRIENFRMTSTLVPIDQVEADINLIGYTLDDNKGGEGDVSETQVQ